MASSSHDPDSAPSGLVPHKELLRRLEALEKVVVRHEELLDRRNDPRGNYLDACPESGRAGDGVISFSGQIQGEEGSVSYSWARYPDDLIELSWESSFTRLAALAHPQRGMILKQLIDAPCTVAQLCELGVTSSTGTAYHHLNELEAAGWVHKGRGGVYEIPSERIIPLMTIVAASEDH